MRSLPLSVLSAALLFAPSALAQQTAPAARIVNPIDEKQLVAINGTVHPLANLRNDRGAAPDEMQLDRMHLVLKRGNSQENALRQLIAGLHTPGNPSYHKWLTPDEFGMQFGPSSQDIAAVETWLTGHGFTIAQVNPGRQTIEFSGNVKQFRNAFHAPIHKYVVNGETHYANASDPRIPAALSPVVGGFVSLNNFPVRSYARYMGKAQYDPKTDHATPEWTTGSSSTGYSFVLAPGDFDVQYDLNPLYNAGTNGAGQTIAIINESNVNIDLVNQFRSLFGLPYNPPQVIVDGNDPGVDGINNPGGPNYASTEAYLDVEWAGAVAPNATVDLVIGGDTALEAGLFLAAEHAVYGNIAPILSMSFGNCESTLANFGENTFIGNLWEQAAAQGITVMVSTGDNGSAGCDNENGSLFASLGQAVNGLASTPYNVAVGGTDFYYGPVSQGMTAFEAQFANYWNTTPSNNKPAVSIKSVIPEQPWNDSQYGATLQTLTEGASPLTYTDIVAGSGGSSSLYTTKPAWQTGFGDSARDLPDVSLFASNGSNASFYPICAVDGDCQPVGSGGTVQISGVGGTSASSPAFAGIMALVNQKYGRQGQADFVLYPLSLQVPKAFNDVTAGSNTVPCDLTDKTPNCVTAPNPITLQVSSTQQILEGMIGAGTTPWYNALTGYDEASGLGTIDANQLVTNWNKVTFASTTTTLTPSETSFTHGTSISISGSVTAAGGTPTGDVALMTGSTEPLQQGSGFYPLSSGSYSGSIATLPGGTYNIWGLYGGDSKNSESSSTPVSITVNPESSGIYLQMISPTGTYTSASTPGTSVDYGTQFKVSALVAPLSQLAALESCITSSSVACPSFGIPTGTVQFKDGSSTLNTALINSEGDAEYNAPFAVGPHTLTAGYAGDQSYNPSTSSSIGFTVIKDTPTILLNASAVDSSNNNAVNGPDQPTVVTIMVVNTAQNNSSSFSPVAAPSGDVTVSSSPSLSGFSGTQTLSAAVSPPVPVGGTAAVQGVATFTIPAGTISGNYNLMITYNGDGNYNANSLQLTLPIENTNSFAGLNSTLAATVSGSISPTTTITITGTVTGQSGSAAPTGAVYAYSSGNFPTGANIIPGFGDTSSFSITLNSQSLFQGSNQITLQYFGDKTYNPSAFVLSNSISNPLSDFTLIPQSSIVPVTAGGNGKTTINLASVNGFSGAVSLTCTAVAGVTCSIPSSESLAGGGSVGATLTVSAAFSATDGTYNVLVIGKDSTGKYVHTSPISAVVSGSSSAVPGFGLSNSGTLGPAAGATTGNTSTIGVSPTNGFTGTVNLTCAVTVSPAGASSPVTCSLPSATNITGADAVLVTLTVGSTATTSTGAYAIAVTGMSGSITQTTTVNVIVGGTFALSANPASLTLTQGATTGNTSTITVSPVDTFTASVELSCAVTTTIVGPAGMATCGMAPPSSVASGSGTDVVTITTSGTTSPGPYTVTVTGTSGSGASMITQTATLNVTVNAPAAPTFSMSSSPASFSVAAGAITGNTTLVTMTGANGFSGTVDLTCAISPAAASDPATCSLAAASVQVSPTQIPSVVVTVNTTAATTSQNQMKKLFWPSAGGATLALLLFFGLPKRRRNWLAMLGLLAVFSGLAGMGCGGGGGGGCTVNCGGGNPGTTPGTYTLTVTGVSGAGASAITQTAPVTVTVN